MPEALITYVYFCYTRNVVIGTNGGANVNKAFSLLCVCLKFSNVEAQKIIARALLTLRSLNFFLLQWGHVPTRQNDSCANKRQRTDGRWLCCVCVCVNII